MAIAPDLLAFVRETFRSVWTLELLLLLKKEQPRVWNSDALVRELRASQLLVTRSLTALERAGLVASDELGEWRYAPPGELLPRLCDRLEEAYRERPVTIINIISAAQPPVQSLADAFKLKRPQ